MLQVVAEDIGIAGQTAEDIPARVFEGLVVNDEAPQYIPGSNDSFDIPEYNPDYDDMPPADPVSITTHKRITNCLYLVWWYARKPNYRK